MQPSAPRPGRPCERLGASRQSTLQPLPVIH